MTHESAAAGVYDQFRNAASVSGDQVRFRMSGIGVQLLTMTSYPGASAASIPAGLVGYVDTPNRHNPETLS